MGMNRKAFLALLILAGCRGGQSPVSPQTSKVVAAPIQTPIVYGVSYSDFVELPGYPYEGRAQVTLSFSGPVTLDHYAYTNFGWYNNPSGCVLVDGETVTIAVTLYSGSSVSRVGTHSFAQVNDLYDSGHNIFYVEGEIKSGNALSPSCLWQ